MSFVSVACTIQGNLIESFKPLLCLVLVVDKKTNVKEKFEENTKIKVGSCNATSVAVGLMVEFFAVPPLKAHETHS